MTQRPRSRSPGRVLAELLDEVGIARRLADDQCHGIVVPGHLLQCSWLGDGLVSEVIVKTLDVSEGEQPLGVRLCLRQLAGKARQPRECDQQPPGLLSRTVRNSAHRRQFLGVEILGLIDEQGQSSPVLGRRRIMQDLTQICFDTAGVSTAPAGS